MRVGVRDIFKTQETLKQSYKYSNFTWWSCLNLKAV